MTAERNGTGGSPRHAAYESLPGPTPIGGQLREVLALSHAFEAQLAASLGCNATDLAAMQALIDDGPLTPSELARSLGLSTAAATLVVDRLAQLGHASRRRHETDRRKVVVVPSETSIQAAVTELTPVIVGVSRAIGALDTERREVVEGFLGEVIDIYRGALRAPGDPRPPAR